MLGYQLLAFTQTSWYSRHNFDPLQICSIWLNSNKATWIGKDLKWQDNTTARVSNFCKEGGTSRETGSHWGPTNPHWIPPTIPIYSFLPYVYESTMYNTNSSSIPHVWHVPCHEISLLLPVFSDQTLQFSINLFICFHAGQPIATKVVIVAPSSLVKVQFYNFTFILLIWFHSVSKFLKGAQNRSEYFKMVTYMYM